MKSRTWIIIGAFVAAGAIGTAVSGGSHDSTGDKAAKAASSAFHKSQAKSPAHSTAPTSEPTQAALTPITDPDPSGASSKYQDYKLNIASVYNGQYPVLDRSTIEDFAGTYCTATTDELSTGINQYIRENINNSQNSFKQFGAEIGATVQSYCPVMLPTVRVVLTHIAGA